MKTISMYIKYIIINIIIIYTLINGDFASQRPEIKHLAGLQSSRQTYIGYYLYKKVNIITNNNIFITYNIINYSYIKF